MSRPVPTRHEPAERFADDLLRRLDAAGERGLTSAELKLPSAGSRAGRACRGALQSLLRRGEIGNLGTAKRPRYVSIEYYRPLEIAYDHIAARAREAGTRLSSKTALAKGLSGAAKERVDEALKLLVAEGALLRLKWGVHPLYLHASAVSTRPKGHTANGIDAAALRRAYDDTVREFGYPDVLIHELHLRLGGELEPLKQALLDACRTGEAIPGVGDWSLSSENERAAALYVDGRPHLRIRFRR
ncbi:MAG TPA: hypothetical protein VF339_12305 [Gammaproteobacteria bacterium]